MSSVDEFEVVTVQHGDWVRFQKGGYLVIGEVCYFYTRMSGQEYLITDQGAVLISEVLECRKCSVVQDVKAK